MSPSLDLSIIIVSWNVWDLLRACLHAIEQLSRPGDPTNAQSRCFGPAAEHHTVEVIVVDNASQDTTVDGVRARFPWVRLIASSENLGFTRGNNRGYQASRGQSIFFLNPDTEIVAAGKTNLSPSTSDSLWQLYQTLRDNPQIGLVAPQLRYGDNTVQSSRRRFPTRLTGFWESTWLGQLWPHNPWARRLHMADWPETTRQDVDWVNGAAMLARRSALEAIRTPGDNGPFDEGFFMYSEELDLCQRLKQAGWRIVYLPEARVIHYEGRSSEQVVAARHIHFNTSKVRYYRKYFGAGWAEALRRYLLLEFRLQLLIEQSKLALGHRRELRRARIAAYRLVVGSGLRE